MARGAVPISTDLNQFKPILTSFFKKFMRRELHESGELPSRCWRTAIRPAPSGTSAQSPQLRDWQARCQVGGENEAKTKPKREAAWAIRDGFGSPKPLYLRGSARFLARGDGRGMVRGKLQNEATGTGVRVRAARAIRSQRNPVHLLWRYAVIPNGGHTQVPSFWLAGGACSCRSYGFRARRRRPVCRWPGRGYF
jgi:hypothetical protein